jgi:hypothetical protein
MLTDHLAERVEPEADALVFTSPEGHPLRRTKFRPRWADACEAAQVTGLHFHDLRGSRAIAGHLEMPRRLSSELRVTYDGPSPLSLTYVQGRPGVPATA